MLKLNETPVRTANNFRINNIEIDAQIPENIPEFENVQIVKQNSKIDENVSESQLVYGNDKELENMVLKKANSKIRIENNEKAEDVRITYIFDEDNIVLLNQIDVVASKNINVIVEYKSETNEKCFHSGIIRATAKDGAKINITVVNLLNDESDSFESFENSIEKNSKVYHKLIDIGAKNSVSNYYSNVTGDMAENDVKTIYLGQGSQVKDLNYIVHLRGKQTNVDIDAQGALKDNSKKNFKGTIDFKKGCKKAKGNENEYCMLLSDKAKSIALPMLLCTEDDVEGNHSTASGKVDESSVFYIMSRGLSYKEAVRLLVKANFNKIIEGINNEDVREEILQEIDERL
jgi:Fe-S cluster assembly protein SufD